MRRACRVHARGSVEAPPSLRGRARGVGVRRRSSARTRQRRGAAVAARRRAWGRGTAPVERTHEAASRGRRHSEGAPGPSARRVHRGACARSQRPAAAGRDENRRRGVARTSPRPRSWLRAPALLRDRRPRAAAPRVTETHGRGSLAPLKSGAAVAPLKSGAALARRPRAERPSRAARERSSPRAPLKSGAALSRRSRAEQPSRAAQERSNPPSRAPES